VVPRRSASCCTRGFASVDGVSVVGATAAFMCISSFHGRFKQASRKAFKEGGGVCVYVCVHVSLEGFGVCVLGSGAFEIFHTSWSAVPPPAPPPVAAAVRPPGVGGAGRVNLLFFSLSWK